MLTHYGHLVRLLHCCTDQNVTSALAQMDLTAAQGHIMGYLSRRETPACSRDIEETFQLSHPTVSGLLARLEKKGFIEFRPDEHDRRCKRIFVLPKGVECDARMRQTLQNNEALLVQGFSEEEKELFAQLLQRALQNMGVCPRIQDRKEETQT